MNAAMGLLKGMEVRKTMSSHVSHGCVELHVFREDRRGNRETQLGVNADLTYLWRGIAAVPTVIIVGVSLPGSCRPATMCPSESAMSAEKREDRKPVRGTLTMLLGTPLCRSRLHHLHTNDGETIRRAWKSTAAAAAGNNDRVYSYAPTNSALVTKPKGK